MTTLTVQYPWAWFWLPQRHNPQRVDPDIEDGTDRGYDYDEGDWRSIIAAVRTAVTVAHCIPHDGVLVDEVDVQVPVPLNLHERTLANKWLGSGSRGVTVSEEFSGHQFRVMDGRHRLWAARRAQTVEALSWGPFRFLGSWLNQRLDAHPLPVRPELLEWVAEAAAFPDSPIGDTISDSLTTYLKRWEVESPSDLRRINADHIEVLRTLRRRWPDVTLVEGTSAAPPHSIDTT
jgi:hypothetical protein